MGKDCLRKGLFEAFVSFNYFRYGKDSSIAEERTAHYILNNNQKVSQFYTTSVAVTFHSVAPAECLFGAPGHG